MNYSNIEIHLNQTQVFTHILHLMSLSPTLMIQSPKKCTNIYCIL